MADNIRPATIDDFKAFVSNNFSADAAVKVHSAAVLFVETVMAGEMRRRIKIRKDQMAHGKKDDSDKFDVFDYDMEDRLAGVLRFAEVMTKVFTVPEDAPVNEPMVQKKSRKTKKVSE